MMSLSRAAMPALIAVAAVLVLAGGARPAERHGVMTPAAHVAADARRVTPDSTGLGVHFGCQDTAGCYAPSQLRAAYGVDQLGADGSGRTIVIVDAFQSPTIGTDLALFDSVFGLPDTTLDVIAPDGLTPFDPTDAGQVGWAAEITLDVEWAHAIAPAATIDLVLAKSGTDTDLLSATRYAVDHDLGDVVLQSFGEAEECAAPALVSAQHDVFRKATSDGVTVVAAAGDSGATATACDGSAFLGHAVTETPASDPDVTAVGGTRLVADSSGQYTSETAWNEFSTFGGAGGGGFSTLYKRPSYQAPVQKSHARGVPDVSYNAAIVGGVLCIGSFRGSPAFFRFGGTSAAAAQWAGLVALADQLHGGRLGNIDKRLYKLGKGESAATYFHDVTTGDNSFPPVDGFAAAPGWDAATGLGTPIANTLVPALAH